MAWIRNDSARKGGRKTKAGFDKAIRRAGKVFQHPADSSLNAETLNASMHMYLASMYGASGLSRMERELMATVVSRANDCFY
jgi:alkylhydroperoxidase family enzyme